MDKINAVCWAIATVLLVSSGLYFTIVLRFPQFSFKNMLNSLKPEKNDKKGISPFETLTLSLAARIGVGSLAGIAIGIYNGGIGVIFWIWLSTIFTLPNTFVESLLAVIYRVRDGKFYKGGPAYYMKIGLKKPWMGTLFAILLIFTFPFAFNSVQSNTICAAFAQAFNFDPTIVGIVLTILTFVIIFGGIQRIAKVSSFIVPVMAVGYIVLALIVVFINFKQNFNF